MPKARHQLTDNLQQLVITDSILLIWRVLKVSFLDDSPQLLYYLMAWHHVWPNNISQFRGQFERLRKSRLLAASSSSSGWPLLGLQRFIGCKTLLTTRCLQIHIWFYPSKKRLQLSLKLGNTFYKDYANFSHLFHWILSPRFYIYTLNKTRQPQYNRLIETGGKWSFHLSQNYIPMRNSSRQVLNPNTDIFKTQALPSDRNSHHRMMHLNLLHAGLLKHNGLPAHRVCGATVTVLTFFLLPHSSSESSSSSVLRFLGLAFDFLGTFLAPGS